MYLDSTLHSSQVYNLQEGAVLVDVAKDGVSGWSDGQHQELINLINVVVIITIIVDVDTG